jgi:hypothetical protein
MSPQIHISEMVYQALKGRAEPFVDKTPEDVIKRLLAQVNGNKPINETPGARSISLDQYATVAAIVHRVLADDDDFELLEEDSAQAYIHFAPRAWVAPALFGGDKRSGRILTFMFSNRNSRLNLTLEIQPGKQDSRHRIYNLVRQRPWFTGRGELGPKYCRVFRKSIFTREEYEAQGKNSQWLENRIRERLADFKTRQFPQIDQVIKELA